MASVAEEEEESIEVDEEEAEGGDDGRGTGTSRLDQLSYHEDLPRGLAANAAAQPTGLVVSGMRDRGGELVEWLEEPLPVEEEGSASTAEDDLGGGNEGGWEALVDPGSGCTYFYNAVLGKTQWTLPDQDE